MKSKIKPMTPGVPHSARIRAYLAGAVVTAGLCGVAWSAYALQVHEADHYRQLAERQHALNVDIPAPRGDVIDAVGRPLAVSADADSIWANPREIKDVTDTAEKLAKLTGGDAGALELKLGVDRKFVWVQRQVSRETAASVRAAKLPGIVVAKEPRRWYPGKTIGGPVIGRADIDNRGLEGIELSMNDALVGSRGEGQAVRDARGRKMFADGLSQPEPGATVQLSLDRSIQAIADKALADTVIANKAKSGTVVVLEVSTGRVLAMSSYPTYDPNSTESHGGARNRPVTDAFESGSVMKVFTVAAAMEEGMIKADTGFDTASFVVGPKRIIDVHPYKYLTVNDIIKHSSNVGAAKIALRLGREKLYAYLLRFGFGAKTGIELPGEQVGMMRNGSRWREIELATIAYGYGLTVTPLQIAAGLAALGNRGVYHPPRIIDKVIDPDGTVLYQPLGESRQMVTPKTAEAMRKILGTVFEGGKEGGTAKDIIVPGFKCGGKTGTAHKYDHETKKYAPDRYLSSFAGLAPIDNPRLAIVVMVDEPSGGVYYGGKVAGPVFGTVASETLRYLGVPGTTMVCPPPPPGYNPYLDPAVKTCLPGPKSVAVPKPLAAATPAVPVPAPVIEDVEVAAPIAPEPGSIVIPDFTGLGVARALDLAREAHLPVDLKGSGRVVSQDPAPGSVVAPVRITLTFSDGAAPR
ncbi:MAG: transpeptidase family protein [Deltaproteobacteria bacterium]|nr:transpeptidase family protein [Deltaproteobacteria bacterium]